MNKKAKVIFVYDRNLKQQCDKLPTMLNRASMVCDLLFSYNILQSDQLQIANSQVATYKDLRIFHTESYVNFLKQITSSDNVKMYDEKDLIKHGLSYDCPVLEDCYNFVTALAGGTVTASKFLVHTEYRIAINWFGGWHHSKDDKADGFCYVNDIVIGIDILLQKYLKVLYVDLDAHHGDGVQEAFNCSKNVLTLSFHNFLPGYYPGTGSLDDVGAGPGKYYSLNVPLKDGINNNNYLRVFITVFKCVFEAFQPSAIVVQCGADILNDDPLGFGNVTLEPLGKCVKLILEQDKPTMFLGGGGYNLANTARYWTYLTSVIIGKELDNDVPDDCLFFTEYGPTYELEIAPGNRKDNNSDEYLQNIISRIEEYCTHIVN